MSSGLATAPAIAPRLRRQRRGAAAADPAVHDLIAGDDPVWVIDPLDGTSNFVAGRAAFGVIVALVVRGETRMGWIHDPNAGHTATAECGSGAWLNSKRLAVMVPASTAALRGVMATKFFPASLREQLNARRSLFKRHRQSHAAGDYVELVRGTLDFSLYQRTLPWDHAAGVLLYAEAGGYSARLDGTAYRPVTAMEASSPHRTGRSGTTSTTTLSARTRETPCFGLSGHLRHFTVTVLTEMPPIHR